MRQTKEPETTSIGTQDRVSDVSTSVVYSKIYLRIGAFLVDVMIVYGVVISFSLGFRYVSGRSEIMAIAAFFSWLYLIALYLKGKGQTIGCRTFGIRVISVDGSQIGVGAALLRSGLISAIIAPLGFISIVAFSFILFSLLSLNIKPTKQRSQTFWDAATKTCVIKGGVKLKWNEW